jgi:hypothetical protein
MRSCVAAFIVLFSSAANAQAVDPYDPRYKPFEVESYGFEVRVGYGSCAMNSLKKDLHYYQKQLQDSIPVKVVNDYPPYYNFGVSGFVDFEDWDFGASFTFYSTGGRIHYADYSGELGFEHLLKGYNFGPFARYKFLRSDKFNADLTVQMSYQHTNLLSSAWHRIGADEERESAEFYSDSFAFTVLLGGKYYITPWLYMGGRFGYFFDSKGLFRLLENKEIRLVDHEGVDMTSDWTGWRAEIFIGTRIKSRGY